MYERLINPPAIIAANIRMTVRIRESSGKDVKIVSSIFVFLVEFFVFLSVF